MSRIEDVFQKRDKKKESSNQLDEKCLCNTKLEQMQEKKKGRRIMKTYLGK